MKKTLLLAIIFVSLKSSSQSVFGYWYGSANVNISASASNYLVELILLPEKGYVKGVLNYYFKNTYRSLQVKGNYDPKTREVNLYNIPVTYFGSARNMEVDCIMNFRGIMRAAQTGSSLTGKFVGLPDNRYVCADIIFNLALNADLSKKDSVLNAIKEYKETYQVWRPSLEDSLTAVTVLQRKVVNYFVETQFKERAIDVTDDIEVDSDSLKVDFYDNGEVDGDSVSVFFNNSLLVSAQKLSERAIHFNLKLDSVKLVNELSMFADNLGSIPPNTALMIIDDGKKKHEIRLTSSLQKNGTVRIRRKKLL